ncbi:MAG: ThuA domain-containing protein [Verrucomicrobiales bacterium]|jgi:type 1 glutamine amidotransferase
MKNVLTCLSVAAFLATGISYAEEKKKPKTWEEKATERFKNNPTDDHKAMIDAAIPKPTVTPKQARKVLVFFRCEGFIHTSIPFGNYAMQAIDKKTDAFSADLADDYSVFTKENLARYDAIIFNNTTHLKPNEEQRAAILDFIESGKGIAGFHAAADNFGEWEKGIELIGGIFNGHPWNAGGTWAFKLEDPDHALNAAFEGKGIWHKDEIYWYRPESFNGRDRLRVLLSLDMSKAENRKVLEGDKWKGKIDDPSKVDVPVSWLKEVGKGRLFYTNLGHNDLTFASETVLLHMLDGIQYALGDLQADAVPSSKAKVEVVLAPDKPE